jgi:hypothetical protein
MDVAFQRLLDERAIERQLFNYCRSMDRCDRALGAQVFHPEATIDCGAAFKGGVDEFLAFTMKSHLSLETNLHRVSNISIAVDGDRAGSEAYVDAQLRGAAHGKTFEMSTAGRYVDQWIRQGETWVIRNRVYLHEMDSQKLIEHARYPSLGVRDHSDPSYAALTLP